MYWLVLSIGSFLIVRYVDGSGCLLLSGYAFVAWVLHRLFVNDAISRHEHAAVQLRHQAQAVGATAESEIMELGGSFADGFGDGVLENAGDLTDVVVGGVAKFAAGYLKENALPPEARAFMNQARIEEAAAESIKEHVLVTNLGILATSALWVALAYFDVIPTPESDRLEAARATQQQVRPVDEASVARARQEAERQRTTTALQNAVSRYEALPRRSSFETRYHAYIAIDDTADSWRQAHGLAVPWDQGVGEALDRLGPLGRHARRTEHLLSSQRRTIDRELGRLSAAMVRAQRHGGVLRWDGK